MDHTLCLRIRTRIQDQPPATETLDAALDKTIQKAQMAAKFVDFVDIGKRDDCRIVLEI